MKPNTMFKNSKFRSLSQPQLNVFKKHKSSSFSQQNYSSCEKIPSSISKYEAVNHRMFFSPNKDDINKPTTMIEKCDEESSNSKKRPSPLRKGIIYAVFLPLLKNENMEVIKHPLLVTVRESKFLEFGFDLPFKDYEDASNNNFKLTVGKYTLYGSIISTGETPNELQATLKENMERYPDWRDCARMIGSSDIFIELEHIPLTNTRQNKVYISMDSEELKTYQTLIKSFKLERVVLNKNKPSRVVQQFMQTEKIHEQQEKESDISIVDKDHTIEKQDTNCKCEENETREKIVERVNMNLTLIDERKKLLSQLDINGTLLSSLVDVVCDLKKLIIFKMKDESNSSLKVSPIDKTFIIKKKNRIFIEEKVEFELDKYEMALMKTKSKKPTSLAYQFVKVCFPESYYQNVTLGKKYYEKNEVNEILNCKEKEKIPLVVVWGFKDPFNSPLNGPFDIVRGQERIRAFIDHIFRKSEIFEYNSDEENKVRVRLGKELSYKNKAQENDRHDEDSQDKNQFSDVWEESCFD